MAEKNASKKQAEEKKPVIQKKVLPKFDEKFVDKQQKKKYRPFLDKLQWDEDDRRRISEIPERFFRMLDELSNLCTFYVNYDEDGKLLYLVGNVPDVICNGQTLVDTRIEMRKEAILDTIPFPMEIDPENPVGGGYDGICKERLDRGAKDKRCTYFICPPYFALYLAYLKASGKAKIIEAERERYLANKDAIDLDHNNLWYFLTRHVDFAFRPYGRDYYLGTEKLRNARNFLDEGLYASSSRLIDNTPYIYAVYDGTYRRMDVKGFGERNDVEPYSDLISEARPAESSLQHLGLSQKSLAEQILASESDFRQFSPCPYCDNDFCEMKYAAFADMLIQTGQYRDYYKKAEEEEQNHRKLFEEKAEENKDLASIRKVIQIQNHFFGCVTGSTPEEVSETAQLIAREISYKPTVSPNIASLSMVELMTELADNQYYKKITDYLQHRWGTPAKNQIYILSGVSEFLKLQQSAKDMQTRLKEAVQYFVDVLPRIEDGRYFILTGSKEEIDRLFEMFVSIEKVFSINRIDLKDMKAEEIYQEMKKGLSKEAREKLDGDRRFEKKAIEYIALNQGVIPYNNKEMASYLAAYINQNGLTLPDFQKVDVDKMLSEMIGMENIKEKIREFEAFSKYKKQVIANGGVVPSANAHMAFLGNPGTGKTTVARIIAQMLFNIGLLRKNTVVEVQRNDLVAGYVGQTAIKTQEVIDRAMGGVLFIDEAYSLATTESKNDFGAECVATLIKAMEDHRDDFVVIFAGYVDEMDEFISSNPGLQSRIGYVFDFEDYEDDELAEMFCTKMDLNGYTLEEGIREKVKDVARYFRGDKDFGNGRFIDSLIQETLVRHAVNTADQADEQNLTFIKAEDVPDIEDVLKTTMKGWEKINPKDITEEELQSIAIHELGHALAGFYLTGHMEIEKITVRPDASGVLGYVKYERKNKAVRTEQDMKNELAVTLSGKNAEELIYGTHSSGCRNDVYNAKRLAKHMVTNCAMGEWLGQGTWKKLLKEADEKSMEILTEHKDELLSLRDKLVEAGTINKEEIKDFLEEK